VTMHADPRTGPRRRGRTWSLTIFALLVLFMAALVAAVVIALLRLGGVTASPSHALAVALLVLGCAPPGVLLVLSAFHDGPTFGTLGDLVADLLWWW
jgi:hypothetical protein